MSPRSLLADLFREACRAVSAQAVMPSTIPLSDQGRTVAIAIGKAAGAMMRVARQRAEAPLEGLVVTARGHVPGNTDWTGVELIEAGHPVPDAESVRAGRRALDIAHGLEAGDRLLFLLSGGASALACVPAAGISLADKQHVTGGLLRSGATIAEINAVRKHLSAIKGGRLALAACPAAVTTWIISDVPGDDAALVGSGPTLGDASSIKDACTILARYAVEAPAAVVRALSDPANETPEPDDPRLASGEVRIIGRAAMALDAAARFASDRGFEIVNLGDALQGEARVLGAGHGACARREMAADRPMLFLSGGETSVTLSNPAGRGGRNLEYLLGLANALEGARGIWAIACDTDGIDGSAEAAGAMLFPDTLERARAIGKDAREHLEANNALDFFKALGDLVVTGPTRTNVGDFRAILVDPAGARLRDA